MIDQDLLLGLGVYIGYGMLFWLGMVFVFAFAEVFAGAVVLAVQIIVYPITSAVSVARYLTRRVNHFWEKL